MGGDVHCSERRGVMLRRLLLMVGMSAVVMVTGMMCERTNEANGNKVLLILVDGCRWDYPDQDSGLTGFRRIAENGVRAPYVTPIFPSNSYPNWYTIVTGLYAENHGFVQNIMYDPEKGEFFLMGPNLAASVPYWWEGAEPLWVTAEKSGLRTALYWWDGCQVEIRGKKPTFCRKYKYVGYSWTSVDSDTREAFLTALDLFDNDEIQLVQVYYEPIDFYGHKYGPDSEERKNAMKKIDNLLDSLQKEIDARQLEDQVNVVVVSDHGMKKSTNLHIINLQYEAVDVNDIRYMIYYGAASMILPFEGKLDKLYNSLIRIPGLKVYRKEEIPEKYHLKNNRLILPLLLVADKDSYIQGLDIPGKSIPTGSSIPFGSHGYDPYEVPEMRGIFFARGPAFKKGYVSSPLEIVDVYNILCHLLDIEPHPNNGSWSRVHSMFKGAPESSRSPHTLHLETLLSLVSLGISIRYRFTCT